MNRESDWNAHSISESTNTDVIPIKRPNSGSVKTKNQQRLDLQLNLIQEIYTKAEPIKTQKQLNQKPSAKQIPQSCVKFENNFVSGKAAFEEEKARPQEITKIQVVSTGPAISDKKKQPKELISFVRPVSPKSQVGREVQIIKERQIKYLGLIIERDIEIDSSDELETPNEKDKVERHYYPIREQYIRIVKDCRSWTIDGLNRKGTKDYQRTKKGLRKIGKQISNHNVQMAHNDFNAQSSTKSSSGL